MEVQVACEDLVGPFAREHHLSPGERERDRGGGEPRGRGERGGGEGRGAVRYNEPR